LGRRPERASRSTLVSLDVEDGQPLGWSSEGTELLLRRVDPTDQTFPYDAYLYILHADGTKTQLNRDAMLTWDATIAPDGSRVEGDHRWVQPVLVARRVPDRVPGARALPWPDDRR
jgi:hypothetical protein